MDLHVRYSQALKSKHVTSFRGWALVLRRPQLVSQTSSRLHLRKAVSSEIPAYWRFKPSKPFSLVTRSFQLSSVASVLCMLDMCRWETRPRLRHPRKTLVFSSNGGFVEWKLWILDWWQTALANIYSLAKKAITQLWTYPKLHWTLFMNCNSFVIARPVRSSQLDQCLAEKSITCILKPTLYTYSLIFKLNTALQSKTVLKVRMQSEEKDLKVKKCSCFCYFVLFCYSCRSFSLKRT